MRSEEQRLHNREIPGWLGIYDINALESLASNVHDGIIVELGSMHGRSAYCLATSSTNSKVYCYDYWPACPVVTEDKVERLNSLEVFESYTKDHPNIISTKIPFTESAKWNSDDLIDLIFIDASHVNPDDWDCIEYWMPKLKSGGILCGHDYYTMERDGIVHYPDIVENVVRLEELLGKPVTLHKHSCVWSFVI